MEVLRSLRQLWRHRLFRRLLAVRVAAQSSDGVLQVALASYVLFSPERQPDAASVAAVLAITLLPFSVLGPFVGIVLDRFSRRQVLLVVNIVRAVVAMLLAGLVATGIRTGPAETLLYGGVLVAMSLNRFLLAALSAALPHTIDPREYLVANSVVPVIGPAGALVGFAIGAGLRLGLGQLVTDYQANAVLFCVGAIGFAVGAGLAARIPRRALGPDEVVHTRARDIVLGLVDTFAHLGQRRQAGLGLATIAAHRLVYGVVTVAMILLYRNYFHPSYEVEAAIADLSLLVGSIGVGFVLAAVVTPPVAARIGIRSAMIATLACSAVLQVLPGAIFVRGWLLLAAFGLGLMAQGLKICVDTLVQAYVADEFKGRTFVIYDMIFNVALVVAAASAALLLPPAGNSVPVFVTLAACYVLIAVAFAVASRRLSMDAGTESITTGARTEPATG